MLINVGFTKGFIAIVFSEPHVVRFPVISQSLDRDLLGY